MKTKNFAALLSALFCLLCSGCASLPEKTEGSALTLYESKRTVPTFRLYTGFPENTYFEGTSLPDADGNLLLTVETYHWFSTWRDGWTEVTFAASGELFAENQKGFFTITPGAIPPALEYPQQAQVRYRDTIIEGPEALRLFTNRWERIASTCAFLKTDSEPDTQSFKIFSSSTERFLFPEVYGLRDGSKKPVPAKENRIQAEGVSWDGEYTQKTFPEQFREVRNSGTLFRDWEEDAPLFYAVYNWEELLQGLGKAVVKRK